MNYLQKYQGGRMLENYAPNEYLKYPSIDELETNLLPRMRKRIMVVDDDLDFRLFICELLVNQGYLVTTAQAPHLLRLTRATSVTYQLTT